MTALERELEIGLDVDYTYRKYKRKFPKMKQSVALVIVSPRADKVLLAAPQKVYERDEYALTLPQACCSEIYYPKTTARLLLEEVYTDSKAHEKLLHVDKARNEVKGRKKLIYVFGLHVSDSDLLQTSRHKYHDIHWCGTNELRELPRYGISSRKYEILMQSLARFQTLLAKQKFETLLAQRVEERLLQQFDEGARDGYSRAEIEQDIRTSLENQQLDLKVEGKLFAVAHEFLNKNGLLESEDIEAA